MFVSCFLVDASKWKQVIRHLLVIVPTATASGEMRVEYWGAEEDACRVLSKDMTQAIT
jgi:hypothetical protein